MLKTTAVTLKGVCYLQPMWCSYSDYDNSGSEERANVEYLLTIVAEGKMERTSYTGVTGASDAEIAKHGDKWRRYTHVVAQEFRDKFDPEKAPDVIHCVGGHDSNWIWIRLGWSETPGIIKTLQDEQILDESTWINTETRLQRDSWESYIKEEVRSALGEDFQTLSDEHLYEALRDACSEVGDWGHFENPTWVVDVPKLKGAIVKSLTATKDQLELINDSSDSDGRATAEREQSASTGG